MAMFVAMFSRSEQPIVGMLQIIMELLSLMLGPVHVAGFLKFLSTRLRCRYLRLPFIGGFRCSQYTAGTCSDPPYSLRLLAVETVMHAIFCVFSKVVYPLLAKK